MACNNKYNEQQKLIESAYTGENISNYLYEFPAEVDFHLRKKSSYYVNLFQSLVQSMTIPVFSEPPTRNYKNDVIDTFINDCDNRGTPLTQFMYECMLEYNKQEQCYVVFDNFSAEDMAEDVSSAIRDRKIPYVQMRKAWEMYEYEADEFDNIISITFYNGKGDVICPDGKERNMPLYVKIDDKAFYKSHKWDKGTREYEVVEHGLGVVPVVPMDKDVLPYPESYDVANTNVAIYNQMSEQRDLERTQGFSILEIPGEQPEESVKIGTKNMIWIPTDSSRGAAYVSPDANILKGLIESSSKTIEQLLQQSDVLGSTASITTNSSGVALGYKFQGKNFKLLHVSSVADEYETALIAMLSNFFPGDSLNWDYEVEYNKEFMPNEEELKKDLEQLIVVRDLEISDAFNNKIEQEIVKLIAKKYQFTEQETDQLLGSLNTDV